MSEQQPQLITEVLPSQPVPTPQPELLTEVVLNTPPKRKYSTPAVIDDSVGCTSCTV